MKNLNAPATSFSTALFQKADQYFSTQPNGKYATPVFAIKALLWLGLYVGSYWCFLNAGAAFSTMFLASILLAFSHILIPVSVAHDGIHHAVSRRRWINALCCYGIDLTGGNSYMYAKKHLEAHQDKENGSKTKAIETQALLLQVKDAGKSVNLPWFFYLFYAEYMVFFRDFALFFQSSDKVPAKEFVKLFVFKSLYITAFFVLPFVVIGAPWWQVLICLLSMYLLITALLVLLLLMPTEKMEQTRTTYDDGLNDAWVIEVLAHNVDFSPRNNFLNLMAGGSNMNVVHYLFPEVNHVHYNKLAHLLEECAEEFGVSYRKQRVMDVFGIHLKYLKNIQTAS